MNLRGAIIILFLIALVSFDAAAQCAMCKAVAESSAENGGNMAKGLNKGILYLMGMPYLLLTTVGFFLFKKQIINRLKSWTK